MVAIVIMSITAIALNIMAHRQSIRVLLQERRNMSDKMCFDASRYEIKCCELRGNTVEYRAFENIEYCERPRDGIQKLNIYAPNQFFVGDTINGYTIRTAPIFMPNTVGGYMQGPAMVPGMDERSGKPNSVLEALGHGYVVACAGIRGRNTGRRSQEFFVGGSAAMDEVAGGALVGRAPAMIVDMKAAIRYLRHNVGRVPGDPEKIITNGTSAGGALSALAGATGNSEDYARYLEEIGAVEDRDDVFAASCYCPIHNLEHADAAYEWLFCGENSFRQIKFVKDESGVRMIPRTGELSEKQIALSQTLKQAFPSYLNSLELLDDDGQHLTLDANGNGLFRDYIKWELLKSAQKELETHDTQTKRIGVPGSEIERQTYLVVKDGRAVDLSWDGFIRTITRMKTPPAFDHLDLTSPENEEFGTESIYAMHFTQFAKDLSEVSGRIADPDLIRMLNPTCYIGAADTAKHWRIRHGAFDRDTSLAVPVILELLLKNAGCDVDFFLPWGVPHTGDYDLDELFSWIDGICAGEGA